jgi:hypothetical protein
MFWTLLFFVVAWAELPGPVSEVPIHRNGLATSQTARLTGQDFAMLRHIGGCEFAVERYGPDLTQRWSTPLAYEPRMALGDMAYMGRAPGCLLKAYTPIWGPLVALSTAGSELHVFAVQEKGVVVDRVKQGDGSATRQDLFVAGGNHHLRLNRKSGHLVVITHHPKGAATEARFYGPDLRQRGQAAWTESKDQYWRQYSVDAKGRLYVMEHLENGTWHVHQVLADGTRKTLSWYEVHPNEGVPTWGHDDKGQVYVAVRSGERAFAKDELVVTALDFKKARFRWQTVGGMGWLFPDVDDKSLRRTDLFVLLPQPNGDVVILSQFFAPWGIQMAGAVPYDGLWREPVDEKGGFVLGNLRVVCLNKQGQTRWVSEVAISQRSSDAAMQIGGGFAYHQTGSTLRLAWREFSDANSIQVKDLSLNDGAITSVTEFPFSGGNWGRDLTILQPNQMVIVTQQGFEGRKAQIHALPLK